MERPALDPNEIVSLLEQGEDWLVRRVIYHAKRLGYTRYTSTLEEAWRVPIRGLTTSLALALEQRGCDLDITCTEDMTDDPAVAFGVREAQLHRARGASLSTSLSLMKYYRTAYEDFVRERVEDSALAWEYRSIVERYFDRAEIGCTLEWSGFSEQQVLAVERTAELQESLDALAEANRVKDDFLASMSHELRTPLSSVLGFSGMLLSGLAGPLNEEQARQVGMIRSSGERLLTLVNDVLDLSRIEAGYVDVDVREFDLVSLCEGVADSLRPIAFTKGLELIVGYDHLVVPVWTDEDKAAQILLNIISNALKFTARGRVMVEPSVSRDGMMATVRVTDTGRGIEPDEMRYIFERFRRTNLTELPGGSIGLGLTISRRLAELLGGRMEVESTLGVGSTFSLVIPVRHESARL